MKHRVDLWNVNRESFQKGGDGAIVKRVAR